MVLFPYDYLILYWYGFGIYFISLSRMIEATDNRPKDSIDFLFFFLEQKKKEVVARSPHWNGTEGDPWEIRVDQTAHSFLILCGRRN